ncbi:rod shape-determining protein MreC [Vallitalea maricola]|uniref:Rod shape-determining protein MreC n=1 Tax=Vallitalea maricola TaxID=3074433 RepID=A0ACB5UR01_9FIRM|nr:rod shape-determining protein MreC [Vallitalea sp. AN17-2]
MLKKKKFQVKYILLLMTLICLVLIIFTWESRSKVSPVENSIACVVVPIQKGVNVFGDWVIDKVNFVKNINSLESMNKELQDEVDKLRYENKILQQDKIELDRLRDLYELDKKYPSYPKIGASVIGKDAGNWYNVFELDKGTDDGLKVNMVVIAGNGLVGHIFEVGKNYAKVKSIIDDSSKVSAKILRTSDTCVVQGEKQFSGSCKVDFIEGSASVIKGDEIVTSHLSEIYPPGILIGTIKDIKENPNKLNKSAIIEPVVDFKHLEEVLVINQVWKEK